MLTVSIYKLKPLKFINFKHSWLHLTSNIKWVSIFTLFYM